MQLINFLRTVFIITLFILPATHSNAQGIREELENGQVEETFQSQLQINNQTTHIIHKKKLEISYLQRYGNIKNDADLYGLYASGNFRLGLDYGLIKGVSIGVGATKTKNIFDCNTKILLLKQNKSEKIPVTVVFFGELSSSGMSRDSFLNQNREYYFEDRLSYFSELMVAHKFNEEFSLQTALTVSYFNLIEPERYNANYGISVVSRYKIYRQTSVIFDFDYLLNHPNNIKTNANIGIGIEFTDKSNIFQIFVTTSDAIINSEFRVFNQNDFTKGEFLIGFNIAHKWDFNK